MELTKNLLRHSRLLLPFTCLQYLSLFLRGEG